MIRITEEQYHDREQLAVTLRSIGDALIATDAHGNITLMNTVAEKLTGYSLAESLGAPLDLIFHIVNEETHKKVENPVGRVLREGIIVGLANHTVLIAKDGSECPIADSAAPILDEQGKTRGVVMVFRDQTEERAAEAALRESEERLHLLIDGVKDYALYLLDPKGNVASWNEGAARIKGYTASEIVGQPYSRMFPPEDVAAGKPQRLLKIATEQGRFEEEGWRVRRDGSRFWASALLTALRDPHGELRGFAKVTRDLTARRAAEERQRELIREQAARAEAERQAQLLRESEERYREANEKLSVVLAAMGDGITMQDSEGRVVYANDVAAHILGSSSAAEIIGRRAEELQSRYSLYTEDGAPFPMAELPARQVFLGLPAQERVMRYRLHTTDEERYLFVRASAVHDEAGRVSFAVNFFRDITEQRRSEQRRTFIMQSAIELSASLDYERTLATVARLAVPTIADWCAVDVLEGTQVKRLAVEHIDPAKVGLVQEIERRYPPDPNATSGVPNILRTGEPEMLEEIPQALLDAAAVDEEHLRLIRELHLRSYIGVPLRARGRTLGVLSFVMAESNRRYDKEDLNLAMQLADRAAVAIDNARLLREAQQARAEAELANRSKDEFLAILGHELRNPLAPITTALQIMQLRARDTFARERAVIDRQVKHLVRLVDDLLDVSRITRGKIELRKDPVVISEVVARALEMSSPLLEQRRHEVTVLVPQDLYVLGDEVRLAQVVANLLNNAAKYTENGGRIKITAAREGTEVTIRVSDTGMGIAPEILPRIFELFVQERQTLERAQGGLGIGLSIVRSIVKLHGGKVSAFSAGLGKGTEICIRLPALAENAAELSAQQNSRNSGEQRRADAARILIVDDNADAAQLLAEALEQWGHETHVAYDGPSGLVLAEKVHPTIAILDIGLPVMDGYELARRLRKVHGLAHIHLLAVTGYGQSMDRERALQAGFDEHMVKPIDLQVVQTTIENVLAQAQGGERKKRST